jgi:hypothetical protein
VREFIGLPPKFSPTKEKELFYSSKAAKVWLNINNRILLRKNNKILGGESDEEV